VLELLALGYPPKTACGVAGMPYEEFERLIDADNKSEEAVEFRAAVEQSISTFESGALEAWKKHFGKTYRSIEAYLKAVFPDRFKPDEDRDISIRVEVVGDS
jgi:hypothetical protein